jgi:uncharacterized protein YndB with AHSA1/START domain
MSTVTRHALVPREVAFDTLVDPKTYPEWLVGAREIRAVDDDWPEPGSRFHHRVGLVGPITVEDFTRCLETERPSRLVLEVRVRPFGRGRVTFSVTEAGERGGNPVTRITMEEVPIGFLAAAKPALDPITEARNRASLNALVAYLNGPEAPAADRR